MTLKDFQKKIRAKNPSHINRTTDACNWFLGEIELFHERSWWGRPMELPQKPTPAQLFYNILKEPRFSYWANSCYTSQTKAEQDGKKYDGKVVKDFYCDENNPTWFLSFNDLDKVIKYSYDKLVENKVI